MTDIESNKSVDEAPENDHETSIEKYPQLKNDDNPDDVQPKSKQENSSDQDEESREGGDFLDLEVQDLQRDFSYEEDGPAENRLENIPCSCFCFLGYETCCAIYSGLGCVTFFGLIISLIIYLTGGYYREFVV